MFNSSASVDGERQSLQTNKCAADALRAGRSSAHRARGYATEHACSQIC